MKSKSLSRREFMKLAGLSAGALALNPLSDTRGFFTTHEQQVPPSNAVLGRVLNKLNVMSAPSANASAVTTLYEDTLVQWHREVVGPMPGAINQRWVETDQGYIYSPFLQPVRNLPNTPITAIPSGKKGFWAEVTTPWVNLDLRGAQPQAPWAKDLTSQNLPLRLYYSQVIWVDQISADGSGKIFYRLNENGGRPAGMTGGSYGDIFWAEGSALRPLTLDDTSPISPNVDPAKKVIKVDATIQHQYLQCFEDNNEVYFCRISSGAIYDAYGNQVTKWATPLGDQITWRKSLSIHMAGGTTGAGFDTPAISWTTFFNQAGMAIHAAFWHNDFGEPRSHGCVNVAPEDAKWIFRWSMPNVSLDQGDIVLQYPNGGTHVVVSQLKLPTQ
jgi:lipoprotein-anchoring transpeptidase ErfK/SrfK